MIETATDHRIITDKGELFARKWTPSIPPPDDLPTFLLFHDSLGCVELWREFPRQLAAATQFSVVVYDRLGFGRSDRYPGPLPLTFIHDEAMSIVPLLCDTLGLESIIPFGHSVGGAMAIATAARLPERCAAVITESAQSFVEDRTVSGLRTAQAEFEKPDMFERLARYHRSKARWVLDSWIGTWLSPAFASWCLDDDLRAVLAPTLALHGDRDEYGSAEHAHRIARLTTGPAYAVILEECGHLPHREQPELVLDEIIGFLGTVK